MKKIAFFDTKPYDKKSFDSIISNYNIIPSYFETKLNKHTVGLAQNHDGICVFVNDIIDSQVIKDLVDMNIKIIALRCAGYNNVDFKTAYQKIHVVRVPEYSPYAVSEHALALIMTLNRHIHRAYYRTKEGNFSINGFLGFDIKGKTIGIIGTGKIGKTMISLLSGFGVKVLAYDPYPNEEVNSMEYVNYVNLDELYENSDIISLHCPLTPQTEHLINEKSIEKMKDGVMIINTGRGKLIDTPALIQGLLSGKVASAGLDVYEEEGDYFFEDLSSEIIQDDILARLLTFPNVIITSHQAFFTKEALHNIATTTLNNLRDFFEGKHLNNEICYKCSGMCKQKEGKNCF